MLDPIIVTADAPDSYVVTEASTATRTETPIAETPVSIQVVPRQIIEDQGALRLKDIYRNVSGVAPVKTEGSGIQFENAFIRGFPQLLAVDSVNLYTMAPLNVAGIEQVEVLKGPASSLYGAIEPGGLINVLPKLPFFAPRAEIYGEIGSYDFYRGGFDINTSAGESVALRFVADYQDNSSFRDFLQNSSVLVAPSLIWNISDQTRLTTWLWFQHVDRPHDNGVVFTPLGDPTGPISRNIVGPNYNTQAINDTIYSIQLEHDFTPDFTARGKFLVHNFEGENDAIRTMGFSGANAISAYYDASLFHNWQFDLILDARWKFEIGSTKHQLLFGTQLNRNDYYYERRTANLAPISIYDPVYPTGPFEVVPGATSQHVLTHTAGGYIQEQMDAFDDRLHILVGGRVDYVDQYHRAWSNGTIFEQEDVGLTWRAGALYELTPWVSPYVNVSSSFNPNTAGTGLTFDGTPLDPTTGIQYEGGLKFSLLGQRLTMTTAIYHITKEDVPVVDSAHPGFSLNGGKMRSQGVELDLIGQITPELQIMASYGYTDTEVLDSNALPEGASFLNIPLHSGSIWLKYTFTKGPLKNFGVGAGYFGASTRSGDNNNSFYLPGYSRFDAAMWYKVDLQSGQELKFQVNAFNLSNERYYESATSAASVQPGAPFTIFAKCSLTF